MSQSHYIRRKISAARERGRIMANRRWELDRQRRAKLATLTAEEYPTHIVRRIVVIDNERTVREATFWSFESSRSWRRKERSVLAFNSPSPATQRLSDQLAESLRLSVAR